VLAIRLAVMVAAAKSAGKRATKPVERLVQAPAPVIKKKAKVAKKAVKASKGKAKKDDKPKVKRAPGPYMIFCKAERPKIVKANPSMAFGEVGKALGAAWGKLSDAQKAKFKN